MSRFDGYTFKNFSTSPGDFSPLSHHRFIAVSEDSNGHLWFTTYNHHVYRLNRYTERFEDAVSLIEGIDSQHYRATHCLHDRRGGTWVAIAGSGVVRFRDRADDSPVEVDAFFESSALGGDVSAIHLGEGGDVWIASAEGHLNRIAGDETLRVRRVAEMPSPGFSFAADESHVYCLTADAVVRAGKQGDSAVRIPGAGAALTAIVSDSVFRRVYVVRGGRSLPRGGERLSPLHPRGRHPAGSAIWRPIRTASCG